MNSQPEAPLTDFDQLWNYAKPDETEQKFRDLLPTAEASGDSSYHLQLLTQIARTLALQRKFDDAHEILDKVEPVLTEDLPKVTVRYLLERGRTLNSSGRKEESSPLFQRAVDLATEAGLESLAVDAAHMLGIVEPHEEALRWNERAFEMAERATDPRARGWIGPLTNNIGWTYFDMGNLETALRYFEKNVEWHTERKSKVELLIARWCVARVIRGLGRTEEALELQRAVERDYETMGIAPSGYSPEEIGECLLTLGREEEATPYFARAYELLSKDSWFVANEPSRLERLKRLGNVEN